MATWVYAVKALKVFDTTLKWEHVGIRPPFVA